MVWITKCFETALNMDRIKSFPLLMSIEVIMKKVADSSELSDSINMYSCFLSSLRQLYKEMCLECRRSPIPSRMCLM